MLLSVYFLLLCSVVTSELVIEPGKLSFLQSDLISFVNKQNGQCKSSFNFVTESVTSDADEYLINTAQKLRDKQDLRSPTQSATPSTVTLKLPAGKTIDNYVDFLFKEDLPAIIRNLDAKNLNIYLSDKLAANEDQFAIKQLPNVTEKCVAPGIISLEEMLNSSFTLSGNKITLRGGGDREGNLSKGSLLRTLLENLERFKAYVYVPKSKSVDSFVLSACSFNPNRSRFSDQVWNHVMAALLTKDSLNAEKIELSTLVKSMNYMAIVTTSYPKSRYDPFGSYFESTNNLRANIPGSLTSDASMDNCDKVYVELGTLPYQSKFIKDVDIVKDMITRLLPSLGFGSSYSSFPGLINKLQSSSTKSAYKAAFMNELAISSVEIPFDDVNKAVVNQMNLIKVPLSIDKDDIILPPTDSKFKATEGSWQKIFTNDEFPHDKERLLTDDCILEKYIEFVFKKTFNPEEQKNKLLKEFFTQLWATDTVTEFSTQFSQQFEEILKKKEQEKEEKERQQKMWTNQERQRKEEEKKREEEKEENFKQMRADEKRHKDSERNQTIIFIVVIFIVVTAGGGIYIWLYIQQRNKTLGSGGNRFIEQERN